MPPRVALFIVMVFWWSVYDYIRNSSLGLSAYVQLFIQHYSGRNYVILQNQKLKIFHCCVCYRIGDGWQLHHTRATPTTCSTCGFDERVHLFRQTAERCAEHRPVPFPNVNKEHRGKYRDTSQTIDDSLTTEICYMAKSAAPRSKHETSQSGRHFCHAVSYYIFIFSRYGLLLRFSCIRPV